MVESSGGAVSVPGDESEIADRLAHLAGHRFEPGAKLVALERLSGGASQETWSFGVDARGSLRPLILRRNPVGGVKRDMVAGMETEARLIREICSRAQALRRGAGAQSGDPVAPGRARHTMRDAAPPDPQDRLGDGPNAPSRGREATVGQGFHVQLLGKPALL